MRMIARLESFLNVLIGTRIEFYIRYKNLDALNSRDHTENRQNSLDDSFLIGSVSWGSQYLVITIIYGEIMQSDVVFCAEFKNLVKI